MRVEIDTRDLVTLVKEFADVRIPEKDLLDDIENLVTYPEDCDFKYEVAITEL